MHVSLPVLGYETGQLGCKTHITEASSPVIDKIAQLAVLAPTPRT